MPQVDISCLASATQITFLIMESEEALGANQVSFSRVLEGTVVCNWLRSAFEQRMGVYMLFHFPCSRHPMTCEVSFTRCRYAQSILMFPGMIEFDFLDAGYSTLRCVPAELWHPSASCNLPGWGKSSVFDCSGIVDG